MIIGISGKIGSGKDTVGKIIQYLILQKQYPSIWGKVSFDFYLSDGHSWTSEWQIKKFAGKLKQIVSILTGIPVENLEKQEVKDRVLSNEWSRIITTLPLSCDVNKIITERAYSNAFFDQTDKAFIVYQRMTVRQLLQEIGTNAMRGVIHPNIWVNALFADYKFKIENPIDNLDSGEKYPDWIITDVRFPNELLAIKDRNGIIIRVNRDVEIYDATTQTYTYPVLNQHFSETALDNATFNYVIDNDSTIEELIEKVKQILIKENVI